MFTKRLAGPIVVIIILTTLVLLTLSARAICTSMTHSLETRQATIHSALVD